MLIPKRLFFLTYLSYWLHDTYQYTSFIRLFPTARGSNLALFKDLFVLADEWSFFVIMNYYFLLFQFFTVEIWKDIPGYEWRYRVSSHGNVYSLIVDRYISPFLSSKKYLTVNISKRKFLIHRLMWQSFYWMIESWLTIDHLNQWKNDNFLWNLWICSRAANTIHYHTYRIYAKNLKAERA